MKRISLVAILGILLTGCSENMPPKCDSTETKNLLKSIIQGNVDNPLFNSEGYILSFSLTGHEMLVEHKNAKEYSCEARVIWAYKTGKQKSEVINYSVFLDSNKKGQFFVQIDNS